MTWLFRQCETYFFHLKFLAKSSTFSSLPLLSSSHFVTTLFKYFKAIRTKPSDIMGNITLVDLMHTLPYNNRIVVVKMTGEEILATLENAVRRLVAPIFSKCQNFFFHSKSCTSSDTRVQLVAVNFSNILAMFKLPSI